MLTAGGSACSSSTAWTPANSPTGLVGQGDRQTAAGDSRGSGAAGPAPSCNTHPAQLLAYEVGLRPFIAEPWVYHVQLFFRVFGF